MKSLISNWALLSLFIVLVYQNTTAQTAQQEAEQMLALVNGIRADNGIAPLKLNTELNQAAYDHSYDMASNDYFSHIGLNGSSIADRTAAAGYTGTSLAENLSAGYSAVVSTFNQWVNSAPHLKNMLNTSADEMGFGHAMFTGSTYTHYWTLVFGIASEVLAVDDNLAKNFTVYPNPVKDLLHINFRNTTQEPIDIKLVAITGQNVYQNNSLDNYATGFTLNLSYLPKGVYFLYAENIPVQKVVKH
jgi:hypothetical protein